LRLDAGFSPAINPLIYKYNFSNSASEHPAWEAASHDHGMAGPAGFDEVLVTFNTNPIRPER
jgi:hypothetical protein